MQLISLFLGVDSAACHKYILFLLQFDFFSGDCLFYTYWQRLPHIWTTTDTHQQNVKETVHLNSYLTRNVHERKLNMTDTAGLQHWEQSVNGHWPTTTAHVIPYVVGRYVRTIVNYFMVKMNNSLPWIEIVCFTKTKTTLLKLL